MKTQNWQVITFVLLLLSACGAEDKSKDEIPTTHPTPSKPVDDGGVFDHDDEPPPPPPGGRKLTAYVDGKAEPMTENEALAKDLTVIDLSNYWVPFIFSERDTPEGERLPNEFRPIFRKLANDWPYESRTMEAARLVVEKRQDRARAARILELREQGVSENKIKEMLGIEEEDASVVESEPDAGHTDTPEDSGAGDSEHFLEVYGIPPSLSVLKRRAIEELDRDCYDEIDFDAIRRYDGFVAYRSNDTAKAEAKKGSTFYKKMVEAMEKLEVSDPEALTAHPKNKLSKGLMGIAKRYNALSEAQSQLVCEGLYAEGAENNFWRGGLDWKTHQALTAFERKNRIFAWGFFGKETLQALGETPKERLYDAFMRVIAERVVDATGIIEDGSVVDAEGNRAKYKDENGEEHEVPNLVAEYSAALMRHMDLNTPDKVVEFLKANDDPTFDQMFVAIPLPKKPAYYTDNMALHSVIDRGDVWYEYPYNSEGKQKGQGRKRMPLNTLFVKWNDQDIPLVTMNTTIGSWRTELAPDGYEYYRYKNSDVGPRVWRKIVAGPVWLPPDTTPAGDMIKTVSYRGRKVKVPNYDEFGPWYASAYGLVAGFHERQIERNNGELRYLDNGIRSHGSVDYNSILRRYSHGCHRLYNHLAIRMFDFVLRHKTFKRVGQVSAGYSHGIEVDGDSFTIKLDSRGYQYELLDPMPVVVERGRVRGSQRSPIEGYMPKPDYEYGPDAQFLPEEFKKKALAEADAGPEEPVNAPSPTAAPATP